MTLLQELIQEDFGIKGNNRWFSSVDHSSLVYDSEKDEFFWNSKNIRGKAVEYLMEVRGITKKKAQEIVNVRGKVVGYVNEDGSYDEAPYEKLVDLLWSLGRKNRDYWYKRCLTDRTIDRNQLGYYDGWSLIPLFRNDKFVNFQCRRDEPTKQIKYWYRIENFEPVLLNQQLLELVDTIYITEGPTDAILLNQEGVSAIAHTGGNGYWNPAWYPLFSRIKNIFYIQDNDEAGLWGTKKVSENLGTDRVRIFQFPKEYKKGYDAGNYFQDGGNAKDFKEMVESNSKYVFEIEELNENRKSNSTNYKKFKASDRRTRTR